MSDPDSPNYGKHLTNEEVHALVAPSAQCASAVADFLAGFETDVASPNGDFITATVSVTDAETLLQVCLCTTFCVPPWNQIEVATSLVVD